MGSENRAKRGSRIATAFVAIIVLCILGLLSFPYFANHSGSSGELTVVEPMLERLILDYRTKTGSWPDNFDQIKKTLNPNLGYRYTMYCDNHPWNHTWSGSLNDVVLARPPADPEMAGVLIYKYRKPTWTAGTTVSLHVIDPQKESAAEPKSRALGSR